MTITCKHGTRSHREVCALCDLDTALERRRDMIWSAAFVYDFFDAARGGHAWISADRAVTAFEAECKRRKAVLLEVTEEGSTE